MSKSTVLQIIAAIILLLGGVMLFQHVSSETTESSILPAIGAMTIGFALLFISKSKPFTKDNS